MARRNEGEPEAKSLPARIRLIRPFGFVENDTGRRRHWHAGEVIADPHEIELLIGRGAPVQPE